MLLRSLPIPSAEFTFGRNKLFVRSPRTVFELEDFRRVRLHDLALLIQKSWRGFRQRRRFQKLRRCQLVIASAWRSWRVSNGSFAQKFNSIFETRGSLYGVSKRIFVENARELK